MYEKVVTEYKMSISRRWPVFLFAVSLLVVVFAVSSFFTAYAYAATQIEIQGESGGVKYYVYDEAQHIAQVGDDTKTALNGVVYESSEVPVDITSVTVKSTVTDTSGTVWLVKRIGQWAFRCSDVVGRVCSVTVEGDLDYVGTQAFGTMAVDFVREYPKVTFNGSVGEIDSAAFAYTSANVIFPSSKISGSSANCYRNNPELLFPVGSYGQVVKLQNRKANSSTYILSPTLANSGPLKATGATAYVYYWSKSSYQQKIEFSGGTDAAKFSLRHIAVLSDSLSLEGVRNANGEAGEFTALGNVAFNVEEGGTYDTTPDFSLSVADDPNDTWDSAWSPVAGTDYTITHYADDGAELQGEPSSPGTYKVKYTGLNKAAWGEAEFTYTIEGDITDTAVVGYDENATSFKYDAAGHAPEINVSVGGEELAEGEGYAVTYVSNGLIGGSVYASSAKPTLPGKYRAMLVAQSPYKTGNGDLIATVPFEITAVTVVDAWIPNMVATGETVTPTVHAYDADEELIDSAALAEIASFAKTGGTSVVAADLKDEGEYTATVSGDGKGCAGEAEVTFRIVGSEKELTKIVCTNDSDLVYTGGQVNPLFTVTDKGGAEVSPTDANGYLNYYKTITDADGEELGNAADLVEAGTYTVTVTGVGDTYAGTTSVQFTVSPSSTEPTITFANDGVFDFIPTNLQPTPAVALASGAANYILAGEEVSPEPVVKVGDVPLVKDQDYEISSYSNNTGSTDMNAKDGVTATCTIVFKGNYAGIGTKSATYTIKPSARIADVDGVKLRYALDVEGNAVIVGLGVDVAALKSDGAALADTAKYIDVINAITEEDVKGAYPTDWDTREDRVFTIPATIGDVKVVRISDNAFTLGSADAGNSPGYQGASHPDLLNGATKLVIAPGGVEVIGRYAFAENNTVKELSLGEGIDTIGTKAFVSIGGGANLKSIDIPASVRYINSAAFGQNSQSNNLESITFAEGSKFIGEDPDDKGWITHRATGEDEFKIDAILEGGSAPITEMAFPASFQAASPIIADCTKMTTYYMMGDSVTDSTATKTIFGDGHAGIANTFWSWDVVSSPYISLTSLVAGNSVFRPFAVLGTSASDSYTYEHALDVETGASTASKDYPANVIVGSPTATVGANGVVVDWASALTTQFVNKHSAISAVEDWVPQAATAADGSDGDFAVTYVKEGSTEELSEITEPGTYEATLKGNEKTCFGEVTVTVTVAAQEIVTDDVAVADESFIYDGTTHEPAVTVMLGGETLLEPGVEYAVDYADNMNAGTATVTVTGQGLYTGEVVKEFDIAQAPLTVTVEDAKKIEGSGDPAFSAVAEGLVGGDELKSAVVKRVDGEDTGSYALTPSGGIVMNADGELVTANYDITYVEGTFTIEESTAPTQEDLETAQNAATAANAAAAEANAAAEAANAAAAAEKEKAEAANAAAAEAEAAAEAAKADAAAEKERADAANAAAEAARQEAEELQAALAAANAVAMNRLYNPNTGEHFYTADVDEVANLVKAGWAYEGEGWTAPEKSDTPVYRLYNPNAGDHHYTTDVAERDNLVKVGWSDEGIGWYSDDAKTVALYRLYNPNAKAGAHHYTLSAEERDSLVQIGWRDEEIGWYGL